MISVGIDVSKDKSTVCIIKPCGEILALPYEMLHTMESIHSLINRIKAYDEEVRVVLEDTGHYHLPVVTLLVENNVFTTCVNALRMKKFCSQSLRRQRQTKLILLKLLNMVLPIGMN